LIRIVFIRSPPISDIEKYSAVLICECPVRQNVNIADVVNGDTFNALQGLIEIVMGKAIYCVPEAKIL
jgi:hypothetical protein